VLSEPVRQGPPQDAAAARLMGRQVGLAALFVGAARAKPFSGDDQQASLTTLSRGRNLQEKPGPCLIPGQAMKIDHPLYSARSLIEAPGQAALNPQDRLRGRTLRFRFLRSRIPWPRIPWPRIPWP
ncbi:MAG: hypothetical protein V3R73_07730, partial [Sphingomonadales bacterium]